MVLNLKVTIKYFIQKSTLNGSKILFIRVN